MTVYGSATMGRDAVVFAFVVPLVLIVAWMILAIKMLCFNELMAVGGIVLILVVYYAILWTGKEKLGKKFLFMIEKS